MLAGRCERDVAVAVSPSVPVRRRRVGGDQGERRPHFDRRGVGGGVEEAEDAAVALRGGTYTCTENTGCEGQFAGGGGRVVGVELGRVVLVVFQRGRDGGAGEFARCLVMEWGVGGGLGGGVFPLAGRLVWGSGIGLRVRVRVRRGGVVGGKGFAGEEVAELGVGFVFGCCGSRRLV